MLGVHLVEPIPDEAIVVEVEPTGQGDLRTRRHHDLGFRAALGCDEVAGIDYRRGERAMADQ
ncbi:hypothetical protein GCM10010987_62890 [Bradyrhizobium guangdongense]|uniref:Uncharacterized protein n=1 Tax=Bradyrhizobium guangdongense TaxID=1325090 RepID=A0AA87W971_9BRAD|nr:hypothetical protein GCM10010987_62890 [Bradyrhizobium guangdongense]